MNTIYATFADPSLAEKAAGALLDHGVRAEDLTLIRKSDTREPEAIHSDIENDVDTAGLPPEASGLPSNQTYANPAPSAGYAPVSEPMQGIEREGVRHAEETKVESPVENPAIVQEELEYHRQVMIPEDAAERGFATSDLTYNPDISPAATDVEAAARRGEQTTDSIDQAELGAEKQAELDAAKRRAESEDFRDRHVPHEKYDETGGTQQEAELTAKTGITTTTGADAASGAMKGAGFGLGILGALAALAIPGVGLVVGGGALAVALAGVAGSTGAGAVAGAVTGYLKDQGMAEHVAQTYSEVVEQGGALLAVTVPSGDVDEVLARSILDKYGASNLSAYAQSAKPYLG